MFFTAQIEAEKQQKDVRNLDGLHTVNAGVRRSLNKKIFLFYLVRRRLGPANTGELVGGTGSHLLFNERRTPVRDVEVRDFLEKLFRHVQKLEF